MRTPSIISQLCCFTARQPGKIVSDSSQTQKKYPDVSRKIVSDSSQTHEKYPDVSCEIVSDSGQTQEKYPDVSCEIISDSSQMTQKNYPVWQHDLPSDLMTVIAKHLDSVIDYVSFRGVCHSWRYAAMYANFNLSYSQVPWITIEASKDNTSKKGLHAEVASEPSNIKFMDLGRSNKVIRNANFSFEAGQKLFSSRGWILYVKMDKINVRLTNLVWPTQIVLPDLNTFPGFENWLVGATHHRNFLRPHNNNDDPFSTFSTGCFIRQMVLSSSPSTKSDVIVFVIWGEKRQLGFSRPADSSWTVLDSCGKQFHDIVFHNNKLYALEFTNSGVVEYDIGNQNPTQIKRSFFIPNILYCCNLVIKSVFMVGSPGAILIVFVDPEELEIFELDLEDSSLKEISDLGSRAIFLGHQSSLCIDVSLFGKISPNSIYTSKGIVYNLGDKIGRKFYYDFRYNPSGLDWVVPSL